MAIVGSESVYFTKLIINFIVFLNKFADTILAKLSTYTVIVAKTLTTLFLSAPRFDTPSRIPDGCIQRAGENVVALVKEVANSPLLVDPAEDKHGKMIFFDLLGLFSIAYPERLAIIINTFFVLLSVVTIYASIAKGKGANDGKQNIYMFNIIIILHFFVLVSIIPSLPPSLPPSPPSLPPSHHPPSLPPSHSLPLLPSVILSLFSYAGKPSLSLVVATLGVLLLSWGSAIVVNIGIGLLLQMLGRSMTWYATPNLIFFLYNWPAVLAIAGTHEFWRRKVIITVFVRFVHRNQTFLCSYVVLLCISKLSNV